MRGAHSSVFLRDKPYVVHFALSNTTSCPWRHRPDRSSASGATGPLRLELTALDSRSARPARSATTLEPTLLIRTLIHLPLQAFILRSPPRLLTCLSKMIRFQRGHKQKASHSSPVSVRAFRSPQEMPIQHLARREPVPKPYGPQREPGPKGRSRAEAQRRRGAEAQRRRGAEAQRGIERGEYSTIGAVFCNCLVQQKTGNPEISQRSLDQLIDPGHSHDQVENALAPLRLCARFSGSRWRGQVGKAHTLSDDLSLSAYRTHQKERATPFGIAL